MHQSILRVLVNGIVKRKKQKRAEMEGFVDSDYAYVALIQGSHSLVILFFTVFGKTNSWKELL